MVKSIKGDIRVDKLYQKMEKSLVSARKQIEYQQEIINRQNEQLEMYREIQKNLESSIEKIDAYKEKQKKEIRHLADVIVTQAIQNADIIINDALVQSKDANLEYTILEKNLDSYKKKMREILEEQMKFLEQLD